MWDWFIGLAFPALLACLVVPYLIYKVYPPELKEISNHKELAAQGLREIGPMTGKEKLLVIFFVLAILGWATSSFTKLDGTAVALLFILPAVLYLNLLIGRMYLRIMVHGILLSGTELSWGSPEY